MSNKITLDTLFPKGLELQKIDFDIPKVLTGIPFPTPDEVGNMQFGIEETKEVVTFAVAFANALINTFEDGKVSIGDLPYFFNVVLKLPAAIGGLHNVPSEIRDLTEIEIQELIELIQENTTLNSEEAKVVLRKSLDLVYAVYSLIIAIKN